MQGYPLSSTMSGSIPASAASTSSLKSRPGSTFFTPNYPSTSSEPVFYLPRAPNLIKVSEPQPPRRPPPPGYDMKTLRKQVDYLHAEIQERVASHRAVCQQNEQLWQYVEDLLQANQFNATQMRQHIQQMHEELRHVYQERYEMKEKLEMSKNTKELLSKLQQEFSEGQIQSDEIQQRKQEAEEALLQIQKQREDIEDSLKSRMTQLQEYEDILDHYRTRSQEENALSIAEDFFFTNKTILKAAYQRFRQGVTGRMRCNHIHTKLTLFYGKYLQHKAWSLWMAFLHRKHMMKVARLVRHQELKKVIFARWKVYTVLNTMSTNARKRLLLTRMFSTWKTYTKDNLLEAEANQKILHHKAYVCKRKLFQQWKSQVIFLHWNDPKVLHQEEVASFYFHRKLFQHWYGVTLQEKTSLIQKSEMMIVNFKKRRFHLWLAICRRRWRFRGGLLRRFFRHSRRHIANHASVAISTKHATSHWITFQKRKAIRQWIGYKQIQQLQPESKRAITFATRKHVYKAFLWFEKNTLMLKRQSVARRIATKHYLQHIAHQGITKWLRYCQLQQKTRSLAKKVLQKHAFKTWRIFQHAQQKAKHALNVVDNLTHKIQQRQIKSSLQRWFVLMQQSKRYQRNTVFLHQKQSYGLIRTSFNQWKTKWGKQLYWKNKEMIIDRNRAKALEALHQAAIADLQTQQTTLQSQNVELEETILHLQEILQEKKLESEKQIVLLADRERARDALRDEVLQLQQELRQLEEERQRWVVLEQTITQERLEREQERERKRHAMLTQVAHMEAETTALKKDIDHAKLQLLEATEAIQEEVSQCVEEYQHVQDELDVARRTFQQQQEVESRSLREQEDLLEELQRIQFKVNEATAEGKELRDENERSLRSKMSEVRVLKGDVGVASARVEALFGILQEYEDESKKLQLEDMETQEINEIEELKALKQQYERDMEHFYSKSSLHLSSLRMSDLPKEYDSRRVNGSPSNASTGSRQPLKTGGVSTAPVAPKESLSPSASEASTSTRLSSTDSLIQLAKATDREYEDAKDTIRQLSRKLKGSFLDAPNML